jgi:VCBS repeat-containing protein
LRSLPLALISVLVALSVQSPTTALSLTTLSTDKGYTDDIHLASDGSNVYVVWKDSVYVDDVAFKAYFARSTDGGQTFEEPIMMTTFGRPYNIQLIPSMNNVFFLWSDDGGLYFAKSPDYGKSLNAPTKVKDGEGGTFAFAASGSHVYVSWMDYAPDQNLSDDQSNLDIYIISSGDGGTTFSDPINVSESSSSSSIPRMVAVNSSVYLVWEEHSRTEDYGNEYTVSFATSHDGGITFGKSMEIPQSSAASNPSSVIALDPNNENNVFIVWRTSDLATREENGILFSKSTDGGKTFSESPIKVSGNDTAAYSLRLVASYDEDIYLAWQSYSTDGKSWIALAQSSDGGNSFAAPIVISNRTGHDSILRLALSSSLPNTLYLLWNEAPVWSGDVGPQLGSEILLARTEDGGKSFHPIVNLNKDSEHSIVYQSDIAVSGSNVYIVWNHSEDEGSDVRFVHSTDSGATFDAQVQRVPRSYSVSIENKTFDITYNSSDPKARISDITFSSFLSMYIAVEGMDGGDSMDITFPTELLDIVFTGHRPELYIDVTLKGYDILNMTCSDITMRFQDDNYMEQISLVAGDAMGDHVHPRPPIFQPETIIRVSDSTFELTPELDSRICGYKLDMDAKAIVFDINRAIAKESGTFVTVVPDNLLGGNYTVLVDGKRIQHTEEFISYTNNYPLSFQNYTRLAFEYDSDASSIAIVGTTVIPELSVAAIVALVVGTTLSLVFPRLINR